MAKPNPNLWSVKYSYGKFGAEAQLWILGASVAVAEKKARGFLKKRGEQRVRIVEIKNEGTIDVF